MPDARRLVGGSRDAHDNGRLAFLARTVVGAPADLRRHRWQAGAISRSSADHEPRAYTKLGFHTRVEAVIQARELAIIRPRARDLGMVVRAASLADVASRSSRAP
jgi:hypothetical protein